MYKKHPIPFEQLRLKISNLLPSSVLYQHIFSKGGYTWYSHLLYGLPVEGEKKKEYIVVSLY